jgi:hypothetical protein
MMMDLQRQLPVCAAEESPGEEFMKGLANSQLKLFIPLKMALH